MSKISREINQVTLSAIVHTEPTEFSNDGVYFEVVLDAETANPNKLLLTAYGLSAASLRKVKIGQRVNVLGRFSREKLTLDGELEDAITVSRELGLTTKEAGADFASAVVGGAFTGRWFENQTQSGKISASSSLKTIRSFSKKDSKEISVYGTYVSLTFWGETQATLGFAENEFAAVQGTPKGRVDESGKHRINVWVENPRSTVEQVLERSAGSVMASGLNISAPRMAGGTSKKPPASRGAIVPEDEDLPF